MIVGLRLDEFEIGACRRRERHCVRLSMGDKIRVAPLIRVPQVGSALIEPMNVRGRRFGMTGGPGLIIERRVGGGSSMIDIRRCLAVVCCLRGTLVVISRAGPGMSRYLDRCLRLSAAFSIT